MGRRRGGLAVFIEADEGGIDGEAREGEVVQVAAEGRGAILGRHLQQVLPVQQRLAVLHLVDGDMAHSPVGGSAVPVLFARREPDHVTRADLFDRAALALCVISWWW